MGGPTKPVASSSLPPGPLSAGSTGSATVSSGSASVAPTGLHMPSATVDTLAGGNQPTPNLVPAAPSLQTIPQPPQPAAVVPPKQKSVTELQFELAKAIGELSYIPEYIFFPSRVESYIRKCIDTMSRDIIEKEMWGMFKLHLNPECMSDSSVAELVPLTAASYAYAVQSLQPIITPMSVSECMARYCSNRVALEKRRELTGFFIPQPPPPICNENVAPALRASASPSHQPIPGIAAPIRLHTIDAYKLLDVDGRSLRQLSPDDLDGICQDWDECEPGSLVSTTKALALALSQGGIRPSVQHLWAYQQQSLTDVTITDSEGMEREDLPGNFRTTGVTFGIAATAMDGTSSPEDPEISPLRMAQITTLVEKYEIRLFLDPITGSAKCAPLFPGEAQSTASRIIDDCANTLEQLRGDPHVDRTSDAYTADALRCIADMETALMLLHPFHDGNGRAISNTLVQHCLLYAGLKPIVVRPVPWAMEVVDDAKQLVTMYKEGWKLWDDIAALGEVPFSK